MVTKCSAIARSGSRCTTPVVAGSPFCWMHDPALHEVRREAARKGGRNRAAKARAARLVPEAMTPAQLTGWLTLVFTQVVAGRMEPKIGTAAAAIAGRLLEAIAVAEQPSIAELEEQLAVLRALIERPGIGSANPPGRIA